MASSEDLFRAIGAGDAEAVRALLAEDPRLAAARDERGVSAALQARYHREPEIEASIRAVAPPSDVFEAAAFGEGSRLEQVLDADPGAATAFSGDGFTALHLAAFWGGTPAARLLLARGADVDARGRGWMTGTPLHSAAAGRHAGVVAVLLATGADPDARQAGGWTPLHGAAHNGDALTVRLLLDAGADPAARNDEGRSVLELAEEAGDADTIALIRSALDPDG
jgi:ankyrin repeat protein